MPVSPSSSLASPAAFAGMSRQVLRKMEQRGPRYTSYPTADRFSPDFSPDFAARDYRRAVADRRGAGASRALSLYLHIPFCDTIRYYCACNKIVTRNRAKAALYLSYLKREINMQAALFAGMNQVEQLHVGGGTPTYLSDAQMDDLMAHIRQCFKLAPDEAGAYAIEVDPRTLSVIEAARAAGFRSISIDLIHGLPRQNVMSMSRTLSKVIAAGPDRIAVYSYPIVFTDLRYAAGAATRDERFGLDVYRMVVQTACACVLSPTAVPAASRLSAGRSTTSTSRCCTVSRPSVRKREISRLMLSMVRPR